jgi:hypothetical protein
MICLDDIPHWDDFVLLLELLFQLFGFGLLVCLRYIILELFEVFVLLDSFVGFGEFLFRIESSFHWK